MAYEKPITIKEAVTAIADDKYLLPAIQREFVWGTNQIETLFDSLMRDYPISTFLFWQVKASKTSDFKFYRFLKNYHERDERHNQQASLSNTQDIIAILDGQQRLTSIYVALKGSHASRLRHHRRASDHAYPERRLYLNVLKESDDLTREYDFQFLTEEEAASRSSETYWVFVGKVLEFDDYEEASDWINDELEDFSDDLEEPLHKDVKKEGRKKLCKLFRAVCTNDSLNFFLEKSEELDKVLQIFIRINQGGTQLSYSDLLLSIATAQWKTLDARKEIHELVDRINDIGKGFGFNKDFVLKTSLILAEMKDIAFKVDNFTSENMAIIEGEWAEISESISLAVRLVAHFGFDARTLTSANALMPIAYFLKARKIGENILTSRSHAQNRQLIHQWLLRALLKRHFGGVSDNLYLAYRKMIQDTEGDFPLPEILQKFAGSRNSLEFYEEDIDHLLEVNYGTAFAFMLLSLFYSLQHDYEFHQDHIFPKKHFSKTKLKALGITSDEQQEAYQERYNKLSNLQLLQATPNKEKGAKMFDEWLEEYQAEPGQRRQYKDLHLIPAEASLAFEDFVDFYEARRNLIRRRLKEILNVKHSLAEETSSDQ